MGSSSARRGAAAGERLHWVAGLRGGGAPAGVTGYDAWAALGELRALNSTIDVREHDRWVDDGDVITSAGVSWDRYGAAPRRAPGGARSRSGGQARRSVRPGAFDLTTSRGSRWEPTHNHPVSIELRRGAPSDARPVADLWLRARNEASPTIPSAVHSDDEVREWFSSHVVGDLEFWVAEDDERLAGILVFDDGRLDQLYVEPTMTGRGIGTLLLNLAKRQRPGGLRLWTFASNPGAQRFYERNGFTEAGRTDGRATTKRAHRTSSTFGTVTRANDPVPQWRAAAEWHSAVPQVGVSSRLPNPRVDERAASERSLARGWLYRSAGKQERSRLRAMVLLIVQSRSAYR